MPRIRDGDVQLNSLQLNERIISQQFLTQKQEQSFINWQNIVYLKITVITEHLKYAAIYCYHSKSYSL